MQTMDVLIIMTKMYYTIIQATTCTVMMKKTYNAKLLRAEGGVLLMENVTVSSSRKLNGG